MVVGRGPLQGREAQSGMNPEGCRTSKSHQARGSLPASIYLCSDFQQIPVLCSEFVAKGNCLSALETMLMSLLENLGTVDTGESERPQERGFWQGQGTAQAGSTGEGRNCDQL